MPPCTLSEQCYRYSRCGPKQTRTGLCLISRGVRRRKEKQGKVTKCDHERLFSYLFLDWGDFFFLVDQRLTFNRVFGLFPHPMYTLGYAFYYGFSLISQSYVVFYSSLLAHGMQMIFLAVVETPRILRDFSFFLSSLSFLKSQVITFNSGFL
jgi:hypothetical protein